MKLRKILSGALALGMVCSLLTGCGGSASNESAAATSNAGGKTYETDYGSVTLMSGYDQLEGELTKTVISDEDVESEVQSMLGEYVEYNEVDRASKEGDCVYLLMTLSVDGEVVEDYSDEAYGMVIGEQEFGADLDEQVTGKKAGDKFEFSVTYDEDDEYAYYPGSTVIYEGKVETVSEVINPELTDEWVKENLSYDSVDAMREAITGDISAEYESGNLSDCKSALIQKVVDGSEFGEYDEDMYDQMYNEILESYNSYAEMFGMELSDLLSSFYGMTEDDLKTEAENYMHLYAVEMAIAEEQNLSVSEEEYEEGLARYTEEAGYDSSDDLVSDYGEESLRFWILEEKIQNYLYEHASITEVEAAEEGE